MKKPLALIILDGWGYNEDPHHNPTRSVATPTLDYLWHNYPHLLISACGDAVGLPQGQIGNSEVGHLHLGAGRRVPQDLVRISEEIAAGKLANNEAIAHAIALAQKSERAIHILGLTSPGGVHSHEDHITGLIACLAGHGLEKIYVHAFLDGRDVPPKSALPSLEKIAQTLAENNCGRIASLIGRYYAMDRDNRWERTEIAYNLLALGEAEYSAADAVSALELAYQRNESDEFVKPTVIGEDAITINDGDIVIFMNFRADRARQLSFALTDENFSHFPRRKVPQLADFITLTQYASHLKARVAYYPFTLKDTLGEYLAAQGLTQLRIAETEKYAHVTYFFNGGEEKVFPGEERILIQSPKVATYDLKPEMSAIELTTKLCAAIESQQYDVIVCNYANPDMVGHTGNVAAAEKAVAVIDDCLAKIVQSLVKVKGEMLITADHGNIECMYDEKNQQAYTAHTTNLVPLIYYGRPAHFHVESGVLYDVAPTLLYLLHLEQPQEMTGQNLLTLTNK